MMRVLTTVLVLLSLTTIATAEGDVVELTSETFRANVSSGGWFVKFYAPWCGHCKQVAPIWEETAAALKGKWNIAKLDATVHEDIASQYGIAGFPTFILFKNGKMIDTYDGARTKQDFIAFIEDNLSGKETLIDESDVTDLTDSNFAAHTKGDWLVEIYAPWCPHCKALRPKWAKAATQLKDKISFGKINGEESQTVAGNLNANGFPTIVYVRDGKYLGTYDGSRDLKGFEKFVDEMAGDKVKKASGLSLDGCRVTFAAVGDVQEDDLSSLKTVAGEEFIYKKVCFATTSNVADAEAQGVETFPSLVVVNNGEVSSLPTPWTEESLRTFVKQHSVPFFPVLSQSDNFYELVKLRRYTVLAKYLPGDPESDEFLAMVKEIAKDDSLAKNFFFGSLDCNSHAHLLSSAGLTQADLPTAVVFQWSTKKLFKSLDAKTPEQITLFLKDVESGKHKPYDPMSEEELKKQSEGGGDAAPATGGQQGGTRMNDDLSLEFAALRKQVTNIIQAMEHENRKLMNKVETQFLNVKYLMAMFVGVALASFAAGIAYASAGKAKKA